MRRYKLNRKKDRKFFSRTAERVNSRNMVSSPMRGGYRL